uniref:Uncharacterized protein n=1 Tax=Arundo donax TaxID=35708 RepID=A0A0A9BRK8_ARUDO
MLFLRRIVGNSLMFPRSCLVDCRL